MLTASASAIRSIPAVEVLGGRIALAVLADARGRWGKFPTCLSSSADRFVVNAKLCCNRPVRLLRVCGDCRSGAGSGVRLQSFCAARQTSAQPHSIASHFHQDHTAPALASWAYRPGMPEAHTPEAQHTSDALARTQRTHAPMTPEQAGAFDHAESDYEASHMQASGQRPPPAEKEKYGLGSLSRSLAMVRHSY